MENLEILKQTEKKRIKKAANIAGAASASMFLLNYVLQIMLVVVLFLLGVDAAKQQEIFKNNTVLMVLQVVLSAIIFTLPFIVSARAGGVRPASLVAAKRPEKGTAIPFIFIGLAFCELAEMFASTFLAALEALFSFTPEFDMGFSYESDPFSVVLAILSVAVIPALAEEFAMRGILLGLFRPFGDGFAIVLSAAIFGLIHGNLVQIPFAFIVGLGLGFITVKTGSIWPACIVHFINNFTSVLMEYVAKTEQTTLLTVVRILTGGCWLALGVLGVIMLSSRKEDAFSLKKSEMTASFSQRLKWAGSAPMAIVAIIVLLLRLVIK